MAYAPNYACYAKGTNLAAMNETNSITVSPVKEVKAKEKQLID